VSDLLDFDCPRCHRPVSERLYGPCVACREELRAAFAGREREVTVATWEPKMNVTPNAVALRED